MVGFEPTPEDWCLKPAPLVAPGSLDHSATSSTCAIVTGFERASIFVKNRSCDPCGSRFQVYRLNHSATLSCRVHSAVDRPGSRTRSLQISSPSRFCVVWCVAATASRRRPDAPWWRVAATASRRRANENNNSDGTRTRNPQIRSLIRCPLRHGVVFVCVEEQGFEPWAFRMQSGRSATELHPQIV